MLLIACSLALLVIVAGMKLLAQTQKETLSNLYKYVSWFTVIMGFLILICIGCRMVIHGFHHGDRMMEGRGHMMEEGYFTSPPMMGSQRGDCMMMQDCHRKMECRGDMMGDGGCKARERCCGKHEDCYEKADGECHHLGKEKCDEESKECPMKKGEMFKKDSIKKNKYAH